MVNSGVQVDHCATAPAPSNLTGPNPIFNISNGMNERDPTGGPFAVVESDSGVFTALVRTPRSP